MDAPTSRADRRVRPTPSKTQIGQVVFTVPLRVLSGLRWVDVGRCGQQRRAAAALGLAYLPTVSWWWVLVGWLLLVGRPGADGAGRRPAPGSCCAGSSPGDYPRGGRVHLRLWLAERLADELGAANLAGAAWMPTYARLLGAKVGRRVDLHSVPPVTGMLALGAGCSVEPEVDLSGHWLDGDVLHIGTGEGRAGGPGRDPQHARAREPSSRRDAEVAPGSAVVGEVAQGRVLDRLAGRAGRQDARARGRWSGPPYKPVWVLAYAAVATLIALLPDRGCRRRAWR